MMSITEAETRISELEMLIDVHCSCEVCNDFRTYIRQRLAQLKIYKEEKEKLELLTK